MSLSKGGANGSGSSQGGAADSLAELVDLAVTPSIEVALRGVREVLGMDVAYTSQIVEGDMVLRRLDGDGESFGMAAGLTMPLEQTFCQRVLDGRVPNVIPDVRAEDRLAELPVTQAANIGAFVSVPLTFANGHTYGALWEIDETTGKLGCSELWIAADAAHGSFVRETRERSRVVTALLGGSVQLLPGCGMTLQPLRDQPARLFMVRKSVDLDVMVARNTDQPRGGLG